MRIDKGWEWFEVNASYGRYITGRSQEPAALTSIQAVSFSNIEDKTTKLTVVHSGPDQDVNFYYVSPHAGWNYLGCTFAWLCIDAPLSLAFTGALALLALAGGGGGGGGSSSSGGGVSDSYYSDDAARRRDEVGQWSAESGATHSY